jgi:hypothetical protein
MPDSFGKRQRNAQKQRKFAAREERRAMRKKEKEDRAAGIFREPEPVEDGPEGAADDSEAPTEDQAPPPDNT